MKVFSNSIRFCLYAILFAIILSISIVAQDKTKNYEFCTNNNNWGDKSSFSELRESTLPATNSVNVDGGKNGGIRIIGSDRRDILVRACVQTSGNSTDEAKSAAAKVRIETSPNIHAVNTNEDSSWGVSYEILVPYSTNLKLNTYNGGIAISSVEGTMDFEAYNGGIKLSDVGGNVKGRTTNGGVKVDLSGSSWKGSGLDVETTNGGVKLSIPENYAAQVETGTVNGGFKSDISSLNVDKQKTKWGNRAVRINAPINGGGAPIRLITTNGGVSISSDNK